jgi:coenzyme F420-0:L-glutamate ligase/coenzyme F420-1:gamma-L-glutamate ligase
VASELRILGLAGLPEIRPGDDLPRLIAEAAGRADVELRAGDIFVVAQKIVSKAEGRFVRLADVEPSLLARRWAAEHGRDPAVLEVVLREARRIVRMDRGVVIAETRHGFICANAGVDASNVPDGFVTLLPEDADASAERLRSALSSEVGGAVGVVITDTFGRPWRDGVTDVALGVAGLRPLEDYRGSTDTFGRVLHMTVVAIADELAAAGELVMKKAAGVPVAVIRGMADALGPGSARSLLRPADRDLFR